MEERFLRFGDIVLFYTDEKSGYIQSSGFIDERIFIQTMQHEKAEIYTENKSQFLFKVVPKLSYESINEYKSIKQEEKLKNVKFSSSELNFGSESQKVSSSALQEQFKEESQSLQILKQRVKAEKEMNMRTYENNFGNHIFYGDEVQFQHVMSGYFLHSKGTMADVDKTCQKLAVNKSGEGMVFKILPRYKYRQEGDKIMYGDFLVIYNLKSLNYLHFCDTPFPIEKEKLDDMDRREYPPTYCYRFEVNLSISFSSVKLVNFGSTEKEQQK